MNAVSLFAGAGGACQGLKEAGLHVVASIERDADAFASLLANGLPGVQADIREYDFSALVGIRVVEGGPPCQPFSAAGKGEGQWDERDCIPAYIDAVAALAPDVFIMENVRGLTYKKHRDYLDRVVKSFEALGYTVEWRVLNAADFGVPQTRQRLFVVGRKDGLPVVWPQPTHAKGGADGLLPWVTMADALGWSGRYLRIPRGSGMERRHGTRPDSGMDAPSPTVRDKFRSAEWLLAEEARQRKAYVATGLRKRAVWPVLPGTITLQRRNNGAPPVDACQSPAPTVTVTAVATGQWEVTWPHERPATTVAAGASGRIGRPGHKDWDKGEAQFAKDTVKVTPDEAAILQDFPPGWKFAGSRSSQFRQIGNACPRRLTKAVVSALVGATA